MHCLRIFGFILCLITSLALLVLQATFTDIVKLLGKYQSRSSCIFDTNVYEWQTISDEFFLRVAERFKTDLTPKKSVIKVMIQEELTKLANEEEEDEDEDDDVEENVKASTKDAALNDKTHNSTSQKVWPYHQNYGL